MEPSWPFWPLKTSGTALLKHLKLSVLSKVRLGRLRARLWKPQGSVLEGLGTIVSRFSNVLGHVAKKQIPPVIPPAIPPVIVASGRQGIVKNGQESPSAANAKDAKNAKSQDSFP